MVKVFPTGEDIVSMAERLINEEVTPRFAAEWASEFLGPVYQVEFERMGKEDEPLMELLDGLAIAAETHDGINPMYDKATYQEWLDEYYKKRKDQRKTRK